MTEITEQARKRATEFLRKHTGAPQGMAKWSFRLEDGLARLFQDHSDKAKLVREYGVDENAWDALQSLILPEKPDPLALALAEVTSFDSNKHRDDLAADLRSELKKRGGRIVFDD